MAILTLSSDLGTNNFALAEYRARFISSFSSHIVVDLFHHLEANDIESIAYQLVGAINVFPEDTVHIIFTPYSELNNEVLLTKIKNQYLLVPNNGILSLIHYLDYSASVYRTVDNDESSDGLSFIYKLTTELLENNWPLPLQETFHFTQSKPLNTDLFFLDDKIIARVLHTDSLGNIVLNIQEEEFYNYLHNRPFYISFVGTKIFQLSPNYTTAYNPNRIGALFNRAGFLELFMIGGNLAALFNINKWKNNKIEIFIHHDSNSEINFQTRI